MNYYEELGVAPTASTEEIRHSYKTLARMLHPDQFPDESVKSLADRQMQRLNQMLAVLTHPDERLRYDLRLNVPLAPPVRYPLEPLPAGRPFFDNLRSRSFAIGLCAWVPAVGLFILFIGGMMYYGSAGRGSVPNRSSAEELPDRQVASAVPVVSSTVGRRDGAALDKEALLAALRASEHDLNALRVEHQKTLDQLARLAQAPLAEEAPQDFPIAPKSPVLPSPKAVASEVRSVAFPVRSENASVERSTPASAKFAGHWFYVPDSHPIPAKGVYVPEYIELRITEDAGILRGRYHARYRITDQAISPEVIFEFEGADGLPVARLPWKGAGDAEGTVVLRSVSPDQLEVSWTATHLSADINLATGIAQLIRQREPR